MNTVQKSRTTRSTLPPKATGPATLTPPKATEPPTLTAPEVARLLGVSSPNTIKNWLQEAPFPEQ